MPGPVCALLLLAAAVPPGEDGRAELVLDEVVAVVDREVITRSELMQEAWLVLVDRRGQEGLNRELTPVFLQQVLDMLINQQVLLAEERRQGLPQVSPEERADLVTGFRQRFQDRDAYLRFLSRYGLGEEEVADVLVRHLRVARLKESRLKLLPELTDERVAEFYVHHQAAFGGAPLEAVAGAIRHKLGAEGRERELGRWIWELRKRSEVRLLVDFSTDAEAGGGQEAEGGGDEGL